MKPSFVVRKYEWVLPEDSIHHEYVVGESLGLIKPRNLKITFKKRY
jgi:hypothetical protein